MSLTLNFINTGKPFKSPYPVKGENVPIIWTFILPPDAKSQLIGKAPDAGKD